MTITQVKKFVFEIQKTNDYNAGEISKVRLPYAYDVSNPLNGNMHL